MLLGAKRPLESALQKVVMTGSRLVSCWLTLGVLTLSACGGDPAPAPAAQRLDQPAGWSDELSLPSLEDLNPDPNVVEVNLEARVTPLEIRSGTSTPVWTYNGSLPGPLIRAKVGDTLVVHFKNELPEATTIHWH